jgi:hypothetical protein
LNGLWDRAVDTFMGFALYCFSAVMGDLGDPSDE